MELEFLNLILFLLILLFRFQKFKTSRNNFMNNVIINKVQYI